MIINGANLAAAAKGFRALFKEELAKVKTQYQDIAMVVRSGSLEESYDWLGDLPMLREWVGDRVVKDLKAHGFVIRKKDWEATLSVSRDEIMFDKLGLVKPRIAMLADAGGRHYDKLIFDLLMDGFTTLCFDGQNFFDPDHVGGSNHGVAALGAAAYQAARVAMMSLVNDDEDDPQPLGIMPTHLVVGPSNEGVAKEILLSERNAAGATNPHRGSAELIVSPRIVGAHAANWFLLDLSRPVKPLVLQIVKDVEFVAKDDPRDDNVFMDRKFLYGVDAMHNAGHALWQLAWGSTGAGA